MDSQISHKQSNINYYYNHKGSLDVYKPDKLDRIYFFNLIYVVYTYLGIVLIFLLKKTLYKCTSYCKYMITALILRCE